MKVENLLDVELEKLNLLLKGGNVRWSNFRVLELSYNVYKPHSRK